jgi:hypothetical protein
MYKMGCDTFEGKLQESVTRYDVNFASQTTQITVLARRLGSGQDSRSRYQS